LRVVAAVVVDGGRVLLVSKRAAPRVFFLPGGKPEAAEDPLETLARELAEELGVFLVDSQLLGIVHDVAALEGSAMEMMVYCAAVEGNVSAGAEIAAVAWVGADGVCPGTLAPAIRNHVLPQLVARELIR
jgi:8-oxo-dGTP pyrophosphatase MutT (NUDIX family)